MADICTLWLSVVTISREAGGPPEKLHLTGLLGARFSIKMRVHFKTISRMINDLTSDQSERVLTSLCHNGSSESLRSLRISPLCSFDKYRHLITVWGQFGWAHLLLSTVPPRLSWFFARNHTHTHAQAQSPAVFIIISTRSCAPLHAHISAVAHSHPTAINIKLERKLLQELCRLPGLRPRVWAREPALDIKPTSRGPQWGISPPLCWLGCSALSLVQACLFQLCICSLCSKPQGQSSRLLLRSADQRGQG